MSATKSKLNTLVAFGVIVFILAYDSLISLYFALFQNAHSPFAPEESVFLNDAVVDAVLFQMAGYRLVIFVIATLAIFSKQESNISLVSVGVLVLSLYQAFSAVSAMVFGFQFFVSVFVSALAIYCLWGSNQIEAKNA